MSPTEIETVLIEVLKEVQVASGREWNGLGVDSKPLGILLGFDSLCSIEATVIVEQRVGIESLNSSSIFISEDGKQALTIKEVAVRVHRTIEQLGSN